MRAGPCLLILCCAAISQSGAAELQLGLQIGGIEGEGFQAQGVEVRWQEVADGRTLELHIRQLELVGQAKPLREVRLDCPLSSKPWPKIECEQARLTLQDSPWGRQELEVSLSWDGGQVARLEFAGMRFAGDRVKGRLAWNRGEWSGDVQTGGLRLEKLPQAVLQPVREAGVEGLQGRLKAKLQLNGLGERIDRLSINGRITGVNYSNAAGSQAAEGLGAGFSLAARSVGPDWSGALQLNLEQGAVYSEPVFLDLAAQPLRLVLDGSWAAQAQAARFKQLLLDAGGMLRVNGNLDFDLAAKQPRSGELRIESDALAVSYRDLLQPWLIGTPLRNLAVDGEAGLHLGWKGSRLQVADLALLQVALNDKDGGSTIDRLVANLHWRAEGETPPSWISFRGASLGGLEFGTTGMDLQLLPSAAYLRKPLSVPFYGGHIQVPELSLVMTDSGYEAGLGLLVDQVSLSEVSSALGWPAMSGSIKAELPRARLRDGQLAVDGDIRIHAFDGQLLLRNLGLEQLGTPAPVLNADLELRRLDLAKVTQTFSFGRIEGRLDVDINDLQLVAWLPNRFAAHLRSSPDDDLSHRISQRAVENLSELGNGMAGALSSGALSIFEDFAYDRIDLRIRQRGASAELDGIPHKSGGFYIVKGAWLPRIDVIGYNRNIDWKTLVERLKSIRVEGVKIQ